MSVIGRICALVALTAPAAAAPPWLEDRVHPVVARMPASAETSIEAVGQYIAQRVLDPIERIKALHDWVADRIAYDAEGFYSGKQPSPLPQIVLRDRKALSNDGIMMVVVTIDSEEARIIAGPDVVTRGVLYLPESDGVMNELRNELTGIIENCSLEGIRDLNTVKEHIRSGLSRSIYARTKRRPIVIPVVMEV